MIDSRGYLHILSRKNDVINVAGHRLAAGKIEEAINNHKDVAEIAVVGLNDLVKG